MTVVQKARFALSVVLLVVKAHHGLTPNPAHSRWYSYQ